MSLGVPIEPSPREPKAIRSKDGWPVTSIITVAPAQLDNSVKFLDVISGRRTTRKCVPMDLRDTLSFVQMAMRPCQTGTGPNSGRLRKFSVSAGALHPIEVLVVAGPDVSEPIIYLDACNSFGTVPFRSAELFEKELDDLLKIVPASGHHLLFVANQRHVAQAYERPISLLWRDAGAVLQTFSILAAASDCSFIPLGTTGAAILDSLSAPHTDYLAVGTALIGKAPTRAAGAFSG